MNSKYTGVVMNELGQSIALTELPLYQVENKQTRIEVRMADGGRK